MQTLENLQQLVKALEAGNYNAAPSSLVQGAALQVEDLSPVMENTTFEDKHIKLQKMIRVESCKSLLWQFDRQLSYGAFGGSAQFEGNIGQEETSDFVRIVVPMCFYSHTRRNTIAANLVSTVDGKKADDRAAADAAMKIAGDIEFDLFRGKADFSNGGVFDGNPLLIPALPSMLGLDPQVRQSDSQRQAKDLMFGEYGSDDSVVIAVGGTLTQDAVEDSSTRSAMNFGNADRLMVDPLVLSAYNKIAFNKERIVLAGSPQDATGAELKKQWVSNGVVQVESSRFLSGKAKTGTTRPNGAPMPSLAITGDGGAGTSTTVAGVVTPFVLGQVFQYQVSAQNEVGESVACAAVACTIGATGDEVVLTITGGSGVTRYYNVYRSLAGGKATKFIGRIIDAGGSATFRDLGNKIPGFVTGFLVEGDTMELRELAPYSRIKLAVTDLSTPEGFYRFCTLAVTLPRRNVILDNLK